MIRIPLFLPVAGHCWTSSWGRRRIIAVSPTGVAYELIASGYITPLRVVEPWPLWFAGLRAFGYRWALPQGGPAGAPSKEVSHVANPPTS